MSQKRARQLVLLILFGIVCGYVADAQEPGSNGVQKAFSIETSAIDPLFSIYFARFYLFVSPQDELGPGAYYLYAEKTFAGIAYPGAYRGISLLLDYKRYIWNQWYVEYQVMPLFAAYSDSSGGTNGFELCNELHFGVMINFSIGKVSLFVNPQAIIGFSIYKSNEPPGFQTAERTNPAFYFPDFYVLPNILVGVRF